MGRKKKKRDGFFCGLLPLLVGQLRRQKKGKLREKKKEKGGKKVRSWSRSFGKAFPPTQGGRGGGGQKKKRKRETQFVPDVDFFPCRRKGGGENILADRPFPNLVDLRVATRGTVEKRGKGRVAFSPLLYQEGREKIRKGEKNSQFSFRFSLSRKRRIKNAPIASQRKGEKRKRGGGGGGDPKSNHEMLRGEGRRKKGRRRERGRKRTLSFFFFFWGGELGGKEKNISITPPTQKIWRKKRKLGGEGGKTFFKN